MLAENKRLLGQRQRTLLLMADYTCPLVLSGPWGQHRYPRGGLCVQWVVLQERPLYLL